MWGLVSWDARLRLVRMQASLTPFLGLPGERALGAHVR